MKNSLRCLLSVFLLFVAITSPVHASGLTLVQKLAALPDGDLDTVLLAYIRVREKWGALHVNDGDGLAAQGKYPEALDAYHLALGEFAAGGFLPGWEIEPAAEGYKVKTLRADRSAILAGVQVGDVIVSADGIPLAGKSIGKIDVWLANLNVVPTRPIVLSLLRGGQPMELKMDRVPTLKAFGAKEIRYCDELEQKVIRLIVEHDLQPGVNENMKTAAKRLQQALRNAKGVEDIQFASEDVRAGTYAAPGWAVNYFNCGVLLEAAGNATDAEKCYRNFVTLKPADPQAGEVIKRFTGLAGLVKDEENQRAWEGSWHITKNGAKTERGYIFERVGKLIKVENHLKETWMTAKIQDEFNASAVQVLTAKSMNGGPLEALINKCFNGKIEAAGSWRLSADKKTMTVTINNDIDIDPANCAMVRQNPSTMTYVR
jgi:tetratricopeptide (TPR) repeat protein